MKPYGLRPGDGEKTRRTKNGRSTFMRNKFDHHGGDENGPKGKHKARKVHDDRRLVHRQARAESRKICHDAIREEDQVSNPKNPFAALPSRPKERIPEVLEAIRAVWEKNPDLRLLQLLVNTMDARPNPLFTVEDDVLLARLRESAS
jgi:hypothetical protein